MIGPLVAVTVTEYVPARSLQLKVEPAVTVNVSDCWLNEQDNPDGDEETVRLTTPEKPF